MGLFSSKSSSSSTTNLDEVNLNTVDNRVIDTAQNVAGNVTVGGKITGDVSIVQTDYGALDAASKISDKAFSSVDNVVNASIDAVKSQSNVLENIAQKAQETAQKAAESDTTETIKYLVVGLTIVGVVIGGAMYNKGRK